MIGQKFDEDKLDWNLLPWGPVTEIVKVLNYGATKYSPNNWRYVTDARKRYFAAAMRHTVAWAVGEKADEETGVHHLAHAATCLLFILAFEIGEAEEMK